MKRHQKLTPEGRAFVARVRSLEHHLFAERLDPSDPRRLLSTPESWKFRPSHHASRGLVRLDDVLALADRRLLSVGAHPPCLEHLLCTVGVPPANIVVADRDPAISGSVGAMEKVVFDVLDPWPALGRFDLVWFPESLCVAVGVARAVAPSADGYPSDSHEARLLAHVLGEAMQALTPDGEIRADGPMSHPNVVRAASGLLAAAGRPNRIEYDRFFLRVRASDDGASHLRWD